MFNIFKKNKKTNLAEAFIKHNNEINAKTFEIIGSLNNTVNELLEDVFDVTNIVDDQQKAIRKLESEVKELQRLVTENEGL